VWKVKKSVSDYWKDICTVQSQCAPLLVVAQGNCYGMQGYLGRASKTRSGKYLVQINFHIVMNLMSI